MTANAFSVCLIFDYGAPPPLENCKQLHKKCTKQKMYMILYTQILMEKYHVIDNSYIITQY